MRKPQTGIACAGCPHRAAYVAVKETMGRGRGRVYCGDAGCSIVGSMHPAATTCPGGEAALLPRYRQPIPSGAPADRAKRCAHFITDQALLAATAEGAAMPADLDHLEHEGDCVLLCVLASRASSCTDDGAAQLADRARTLGVADVVTVDPFDTLAASAMVENALAAPGVHAIVFVSPCAQLLRSGAPEPAEVDRYTCVGCRRCEQITGCPALTFTPPVASIDPEACAGCDLCGDYCRTHVIYTPRLRMSPAEKHVARLAMLPQQAKTQS